METCPTIAELVEKRIDRIRTQYRESPNLIFMLRTYLEAVADVAVQACALPDYFDLDDAVGDQLTLIGKRLGFPRCHCYCYTQPVFGFECEDITPDRPIVGFCEFGSWDGCGETGFNEICIDDDEIYRKFLSIRRYQMMQRYSMDDLKRCVRIMYGNQADIIESGRGRVVIAPARDLNADEVALLPVAARVMPVAPGIQIRYHFGSLRVFGFGEGWGGFCEEFAPDGLPILIGPDTMLLVPGVDTGDPEQLYLSSGPLTKDAEFLCEVDVNPYDCP